MEVMMVSDGLRFPFWKRELGVGPGSEAPPMIRLSKIVYYLIDNIFATMLSQVMG